MAINCEVQHIDDYKLLDDIDILKGADFSVNHAGDLFNQGCLFFSFGLRFFFISFPLIMYFFGPWHLLIMSLALVILLWIFDHPTGLAGSDICSAPTNSTNDEIEMTTLSIVK